MTPFGHQTWTVTICRNSLTTLTRASDFTCSKPHPQTQTKKQCYYSSKSIFAMELKVKQICIHLGLRR